MQRIPHSKPSVTERKVRRVTPWIFLLLMFALLFIVAATLFLRVFIVRSVTCTFDKNPCPEPITAELQQVIGKPLVFASINSSAKKMKAAMPQVSSITTRIQFPSTLRVEVQGSNVSCAVYSSPDKGYFLLSDEARVSGTAEGRPQGLVLLQFPGRVFVLGDQIDEDATGFCLEMERSATYSSISAIEWRGPQEIALYLTNGKTALVSVKDLVQQLGTLQRFLGEATMIEKASIIDLRFSHPVLR